ncbi:hypothetical protein BJV78DRAFT_946692 [Lactifluus subvellereus]|nr:hypothetical protein BJV78DRAFT_946692 [Lactifluus subvellereus]
MRPTTSYLPRASKILCGGRQYISYSSSIVFSALLHFSLTHASIPPSFHSYYTIIRYNHSIHSSNFFFHSSGTGAPPAPTPITGVYRDRPGLRLSFSWWVATIRVVPPPSLRSPPFLSLSVSPLAGDLLLCGADCAATCITTPARPILLSPASIAKRSWSRSPRCTVWLLFRNGCVSLLPPLSSKPALLVTTEVHTWVGPCVLLTIGGS